MAISRSSLLITCFIIFGIVFVGAAPMEADLIRARTKVPRPHVQGQSWDDVVRKLNSAHAAQLPSGIDATPCEQWHTKDLADLLEMLFEHREPQLDMIYQETNDRRTLLEGAVSSAHLGALRDKWAVEAKLVEADPSLAWMLRDKRCYDAVMWWTHHIPTIQKHQVARRLSEIKRSVGFNKLPLLPIPKPYVANANASQAARRLYAAYKGTSKKAMCHQEQCFTGSKQPYCQHGQQQDPDSGQTDGIPMPKPWPTTFISPFISPTIGKRTTGNYSIISGLASRIDLADGSHDHLCQRFHNNTPCTMLTVDGFRYLDFPDLNKCCTCCSYGKGSYPCSGPLSVELFLSNMTGDLFYVGQKKFSNLTCDGWNHWGSDSNGNFFWSLAEQGDPRFGMPIAIDGANYLYTESQPAHDMYIFDPDHFATTVDPLIFQVPLRCRESRYCGKGVCASSDLSEEVILYA